MDNNNGVFITFEGPECAGKTTQITLLKEYLSASGREVVVTREPGGTEIGEALRGIVKHHRGSVPVSDETEVLLFAASRAQHVAELISPALERGCAVICDRFIDSTTAYQGYARGLDMDFIRQLNDFAVGDCLPDLTVLLDISADESLARGRKREDTLFVFDRIESEEIDFHRRVREGFLRIAEAEPGRVKVVSALGEIDDIHEQIASLVGGILK